MQFGMLFGPNHVLPICYLHFSYTHVGDNFFTQSRALYAYVQHD